MVLENLSQMAQAVEDNWCDAWASLAGVQALPQTQVDETPQYLRVYTPGIPEMLLNMMIRYRSEGPVEREALERIIEPYRQHHLPFQWWLTLGAEPAGLRDQLRRLGLQTWGGATAMALSLNGWQPHYRPPIAGAFFRRIASAAEARSALDVICQVFFVPSAPMARWTTENDAFDVYVAHWDGRVVAALATLRKGHVVGVYHVATVAGARRRGIAGNLLIMALREAQAAGCTLATLTATSEARHLYERLGFRSCGTIEQWAPGPQLSRALYYGDGAL